MAIRNMAFGLAALAAAAVALPASGAADHEHWFFDSYQAQEYQTYPPGYYRPLPPRRWVAPYPTYLPPPAYRPPPRWSRSAPPRYWFPPTEPPRQWRPSAQPPYASSPPGHVEPPVPKSKPAGVPPGVAARGAPTALPGMAQRPTEPDIVTGSLPEVEPRAAQRPAEPDVAATTAPQAAPRTEARPAPETAGKVSCEAAAEIVGGFGFSDVRATRCEGQVYDFEATRDGQGYSIKLSAADGELTEVRKH